MFAEKLTQLRKQKNLTQQKLAEKLNVSKQSIYKWENKLNNPDTHNLKLIANFFEIKIDDLINNKTLEEINEEVTPLLNKQEKQNLKKYFDLMPLFGLISTILAAILFLVIWDYKLNLALFLYISLPLLFYIIGIYIPYKIIEKKRKK